MIGLRAFKRFAGVVIGFTALFMGIAMLVLPGPGIVFIIIGLSLLAAEFVWARYMLNRIKRLGNEIKDEAVKVGRSVKNKL